MLRLRPDYLFVKALRLAATLAPPPARPGSFWCHTQQQFTCIHTPDTCVRLRPQPCAAPCAADADGVPDVVVLCATCGLYSTAAGSAQPASAAGAPPRRALLQLLYDHVYLATRAAAPLLFNHLELLVEGEDAAAEQGRAAGTPRRRAEPWPLAPAVTRCAAPGGRGGTAALTARCTQPDSGRAQPLYCPRRGTGPYGGPVHECMLLDALASSGAARLRLRYLSVRTVHARVLRLADTSRCAAATQLYTETERGKVGRNAAFDAAAEERYWQKG